MGQMVHVFNLVCVNYCQWRNIFFSVVVFDIVSSWVATWSGSVPDVNGCPVNT